MYINAMDIMVIDDKINIIFVIFFKFSMNFNLFVFIQNIMKAHFKYVKNL
jgi:hypothetical protein